MATGFAQDGRAAAASFDETCASIITGDSRADDRRRRIVVSQERVTIERSYRGIAMRLSVPIAAYRGVCVALKARAAGGFVYQIRLDHRDAELCVPLAEAPDDSEIWADWRSWAGFFGLPALIERNDGLAVWGPNPGLSRPASSKRREKRRRPAFLARRFAPAGGPPVVHREAELIARDLNPISAGRTAARCRGA